MNTPESYIASLPVERQAPMAKLRNTIRSHLPEGFKECINYKMIGYVVPHSIYPKGYHTNPSHPLPFIHIASQKNHIALYHSCVYADQELLQWFQEEYPKHVSTKLDMGKSCIRFKNMDTIPYDLIRQLVQKVTVDQWIKAYEKAVQR